MATLCLPTRSLRKPQHWLKQRWGVRGRAKPGRLSRSSQRVRGKASSCTGTPVYRHCVRARNRDENKRESKLGRHSRSSQRVERESYPRTGTPAYRHCVRTRNRDKNKGERQQVAFSKRFPPPANWSAKARPIWLSPSLPFSVSARAVAFSTQGHERRARHTSVAFSKRTAAASLPLFFIFFSVSPHPVAGARKPVYLALSFIFFSVSLTRWLERGRRPGFALPLTPLLCFRQSSGFLTL